MNTVSEFAPGSADLKLMNSIFPVSRETISRLAVLVECVHAWQKKTNLIAPSTLQSIWLRHVADSLQSFSINPNARAWLDVGSGGGFPGLVVAAVLADVPASTVHLVESNQKKAAFLQQAARKMNVPVVVHNDRIESLAEQITGIDVVTARAFAPLAKLLEMTEPWLINGSTGIFHKGRDYLAELEECNGLWTLDLVDHKSSIEDDSVILEICNVRRA